MQPTPDHAEAAAALVRPARASDPTPNPPAFDAFLAAIERLSTATPDDDTGVTMVAHVAFADSYADPGRVGTNGASVAIEMAEASGRPLSGESPALFLTPDDAERRGWELIALAHRARMGG